jgi:hypothetical protein
MTDIELDETTQEQPRRLHFEWLLPTLISPRRTLEAIAQQPKAVWLTPLLVLSILTIVLALVAGPVRQQAAQMGNTALPEGFEYWSIEQQEAYMQTMQSTSGPMFTYVFPALGALLGIWINWLLLSILLHLGLTLVGSRSSSAASFNLVGWASLPLGLRSIVQGIAILSTQTLIRGQGLSGFITPAGGFSTFASALLGFVDIYFLWMVVLLLIGVRPISHLNRSKAWTITLFIVLLTLALRALPAFLAGQLGGLLNGSGGFFYF